MDDNKNFCAEHGTACYKLEQIQTMLSDLSKKLENSVAKEELTTIIQRLEKDISELKKADQSHYDDISAIRQSISSMQTVLELFKKSQDELRQDYKQLFDIINKIYGLLQANLQSTMDRELEKAEEKLKESKGNKENKDGSKATNLWSVLGVFTYKYGKFLIPAIWIIVALLVFAAFENRQEILRALNLMK